MTTIEPTDKQREEDILKAVHEVYPPPDYVKETANVSPSDYAAYRQKGTQDPVSFWEDRAREMVDWFQPWEKVLDNSNPPFFKWFVGAKTNIAYNAVDRHVKTWRKNKLAIVWEGE